MKAKTTFNNRLYNRLHCVSLSQRGDGVAGWRRFKYCIFNSEMEQKITGGRAETSRRPSTPPPPPPPSPTPPTTYSTTTRQRPTAAPAPTAAAAKAFLLVA